MVALLFFLYGARLSREAVIAGLTRWRLHLLALTTTFIAFPLVGLALGPIIGFLFPTALIAAGVIYLCCLPSTIQSSVTFVAAARGDVAAAVCSASASNIVGVFLTPLLVGLMLHARNGEASVQAMEAIVVQLLLPFIAGQLMRRWLGPWTVRNSRALGLFDKGVILLIVYGAFSAAVVAGVWRQVSLSELAVLALFCAVLLGLALAALRAASRALRFPPAEEIVAIVCGSQKGLAAGVPMASLLFAPAEVGLILLPVMIYHQLQLIACAFLAQAYARRSAN